MRIRGRVGVRNSECQVWLQQGLRSVHAYKSNVTEYVTWYQNKNSAHLDVQDAHYGG